MCDCFRQTGGTSVCPVLAPLDSQLWPPGALHRTQAEATKQGAGLPQAPSAPGRRPQGRFLGDDGAGRRQPGSWVHKCLACTAVAQIQTKSLVSSHLSNPLPIYGHFPSHTSPSHISSDFCWDLALPRLQDLPRAAHGSYLLCSSTFAHRLENFQYHPQLVCPSCSSPSLPALVSPLFWKPHLAYFSFRSGQSPPSCRIPLLFFPYTTNSLTLFPAIGSLVPLFSWHCQILSYLKMALFIHSYISKAIFHRLIHCCPRINHVKRKSQTLGPPWGMPQPTVVASWHMLPRGALSLSSLQRQIK